MTNPEFTITKKPPRPLSPAEKAVREYGGALRRNAPPDELVRLRRRIAKLKLTGALIKAIDQADPPLTEAEIDEAIRMARAGGNADGDIVE